MSVAGQARGVGEALPCARIARYESPKAVELVDALPKTSTGKMQKFELREKEGAGHVSRIQG